MASMNIDSGTAQKIANKISGREIEAAYDAYVSSTRRAIRVEKYPPHDPNILRDLSSRIAAMRSVLSLIGVNDDLLEVVD